MSSQSPTLYCANHPDIETTLRCNRCEKPICAKCAVRTPTGYRCKDCVRTQQKSFETAAWYDYLLASGIGLILSYVGSRLVSYVGFFTIFVAPIAGVIIAEAIRLVIRRRRSKRLFQVSALSVAVGSLPVLLQLVFFVLSLFSGGAVGFGFILPLIWQGVYFFIVTSTVYYRLAGIRI